VNDAQTRPTIGYQPTEYNRKIKAMIKTKEIRKQNEKEDMMNNRVMVMPPNFQSHRSIKANHANSPP